MASLCVVVVPPLGDLAEVYGSSDFLLDRNESVERPCERILGARERLAGERQRLHRHKGALGFDTETVAATFLDHLKRSSEVAGRE